MSGPDCAMAQNQERNLLNVVVTVIEKVAAMVNDERNYTYRVHQKSHGECSEIGVFVLCRVAVH